MNTTGIVEVASFAALVESDCVCGDHVDLAADEIGCQCREPLRSDLLPNDIQSRRYVLRCSPLLPARAEIAATCVAYGAGVRTAEKADNRYCRLLRLRCVWRRPRTAQQQHQLAAVHSFASLFARDTILCLASGMIDSDPKIAFFALHTISWVGPVKCRGVICSKNSQAAISTFRRDLAVDSLQIQRRASGDSIPDCGWRNPSASRAYQSRHSTMACRLSRSARSE